MQINSMSNVSNQSFKGFIGFSSVLDQTLHERKNLYLNTDKILSFEPLNNDSKMPKGARIKTLDNIYKISEAVNFKTVVQEINCASQSGEIEFINIQA